MKNTVIELLNKKHAQKVKKYFIDNGLSKEKADKYAWNCTKEGGTICRYYGYVNGNFSNYHLLYLKEMGIKIKTLEELTPTRGDRVLVWNDNKKDAEERIYLGTIEGATYPFIVVNIIHEENFKRGEKFYVNTYKNMIPIPKDEIVEITLGEVAELLGKDVNQIRIKK